MTRRFMYRFGEAATFVAMLLMLLIAPGLFA